MAVVTVAAACVLSLLLVRHAAAAETAKAKGDPVMNGFDGSTFEFFGRHGANYTVLSTPEVAINMQLVSAGPDHIRHQGGEGTFIGGVAIVLPSFTLVGLVNEAGNMTVTIDGAQVDIEAPWKRDFVAYDPYVPDLGQRLTLTQPPFIVTVVAVKEFTDTISGHNRGHFDIYAEITSPTVSCLSGVLGQTSSVGVRPSPSESSFEIPALTFRAIAGLRTSISRRLLFSGDEAVLPLRASLTSSFSSEI